MELADRRGVDEDEIGSWSLEKTLRWLRYYRQRDPEFGQELALMKELGGGW